MTVPLPPSSSQSPTSPPPSSPPGRHIRWPGGSPVDTMIVVVLAVASVLGVASEMAAAPQPFPNAAGGYALTVAATLPLLMRRRHPVATTALTVAAILAYHLLGYPGLALALTLFVAIYSNGAYARSKWSWLFGLAGVAAAHIIPVLPPHRVSWESYAVTGPVVGLAATLVLGIAARVRRVDGEQRVRAAAVTAQAQLHQRLAEERLAIARELHDVLAHTISVIVVQSGVALDAIDSDVDAARAAMRNVRGVARRAMPDLRGALTLLRAAGNQAGRETGGAISGVLAGSDLLAQPGLAELPQLIDSTRGAGLAVTLECAGPIDDVSPLVALAAYRIVQEALTNVVRHAHAHAAHVTVSRVGTDLVVDVVDDGGATDGGATDGGATHGGATHGRAVLPADGATDGLGLVGMRERAALVGGTVAITGRPDADHGVRVRARLPIGAPAS